MMLKLNLIALPTLVIVSLILLMLASSAMYFQHLQVDVVVFSQRVEYFLKHSSLTGLPHNEYQPGAIFFFLLLSPFLSTGGYEMFQLALFAANFLFILINGIIFWKLRGSNSLFIFSILLLAIGPILLFRFDLLVATLVNLAFYFWLRDKKLSSAFILGIATDVKIYPVLFLPYFLISTWKNKSISEAINQLLAYLTGLVTFLALYITLFQANLSDIFSSLNYHILKPISTDNIYGLFAIFYNLVFLGKYPELISAYGTNGFSNQDAILPLWVYNYLWVVPFLIIHVLLIKKKIYETKNGLIFCLTNLLFFLIFTKSVAPQYFIWFIALIPLLPSHFYKTKPHFIILILLILSLFFYQYIYPLKYNLWLDALRPPHNFRELLVVNIARNIFTIVISIYLSLLLLRNRIVS